MGTTALLPLINSPEHYRELFKSNSIWEPVIQVICQKHQLDLNVLRSEMGSHIVYKAGAFWIKLMAPIYVQEMKYEVAGLKSVAGRLSIMTPEVVGEGQIEGWPYIILTDVPGEAIKYAWPKLMSSEQVKIIKALALTLKELARCTADDQVKNRFNWNEFVTNQFENCEAQQMKKKMPQVWLKEVKSFLLRFSLQEFIPKNPVFLHCDLTDDHFLLQRGSEVRLSGLIDMADCQWGHPEYELAAPAVFILKNNRDGLRFFLQEWGLDNLDQRFSEKLLAWCLLHRYFGLSTYFQSEMEACEPGNFRELASLVFPL